MRETKKPSQRAGFARVQELRRDRADQSQPEYTTLEELDKDVQQFGRELQHFRAVTLEPRVCVYGISASVPFLGRAGR
jgi:hypothetical protein